MVKHSMLIVGEMLHIPLANWTGQIREEYCLDVFQPQIIIVPTYKYIIQKNVMRKRDGRIPVVT